MTAVQTLIRKLNYSFRDSGLLRQALTHRSAHQNHNERLEFLGDGLLNTVIAHALYQQFPNDSEGYLSQWRANLVKKDTLAKIAHEINLGQYLILGSGELKSGGFRRASILADTLEAIFAAIFLDGGYAACEETILYLFRNHLERITEIPLKDYKTQLQEYLQAKQLALPHYQLMRSVENEENTLFYVTCTIPDLNQLEHGEGCSRRKAEQDAAEKLLKRLKK